MSDQVPLPGFEPASASSSDLGQLHTLYFMLMLPQAAQLQAVRRRRTLQMELGLRGSFIEPARMHLTLLALGQRDGEPEAADIDALRHAADCVQAESVSVVLDRALSFQRAFVLASGSSNPQMNSLRAALRQALRKVGWGHASNTRAHVTLSYEPLRHAERDVPAVHWHATSFCLIDSLYGRHEHRRLGEWPLHTSP